MVKDFKVPSKGYEARREATIKARRAAQRLAAQQQEEANGQED